MGSNPHKIFETMAKIETFMNEKIINDRMTLELAVLFRCAEISEESFIHALVDLTDRKLKMDGAGNLSSIDGFYLGSSYCLDNFPDCGEFKASLTTHIIHCDGIPFCKGVFVKGRDGFYLRGYRNADIKADRNEVIEMICSFFQADGK